jgi:hypothetical protein
MTYWGPPLDFFVEYEEAKMDERMSCMATVRIENADGLQLYISRWPSR